MQPSIEQRHSPKRRVSARHDPRIKRLGFSSRQWPFLYVLVGNWVFALAFFLGVKLVWHWVPTEWSNPGDRIALVLKGAVFALLPGVIGICIVAAQRLDPEMWVGRIAKTNSALDINTRFILNTFEQFTAYFVANAAVSLFTPAEEARSLPILTMLFVLGRILFWIGYHKNPYLRAFGFGITFYPTVAVYIWLVLFMLFGVRIPLF
jgi:MAPEG family